MSRFIVRNSLVLVTMHLFASMATGQSHGLAFSTFFGGSAGEGIRDVEVDRLGNVYVAGTTRSPDFPTTPGAYDEHLDTSLGTTSWGYNSEIFVARFSPAGNLVWSTIIGGPNSEEAYGLEIDSKGYIVVHGRGARDSPVTPRVYQGQFKGCGGDPGNPHNTAQNAYICKLTPDGSSLVWASFFGIDHLHRDLALDKNDDIYVTWGVRPGENDPSHWNTWMDSAWNANAFQPHPLGGADCGVAKISSDGSRVIWATYLGGSDYDSIEASIDVDDNGYVYVGLQTRSRDIPTTPGAHDRTHNGGVDWYVAKLLPDGSDIVYGTYIGDEGDNWLNTHNLVVDNEGNCYSSTCAFSSSFPTTPGAIQRTYGGGNVDWGIVKLSPTGALLAGTLLGGSGGDNPDGIRIDSQGNLVLFGQTGSANFPVSSNAYQSTKGSQDDAVIVKLSPNLDRLIYSTFLGGNGNDAGRAGCVGSDGSMTVAGSTSGGDWPTKNAFQNTLRGTGDAIVAKLFFQPAVDFNLDGNVNFKDFARLGRCWFQDEPLVDIAPVFLGNDIVDFADAAVFAQYWLTLPGIAAHWKLNEAGGTMAHDSAGGNVATLHGGPVWQPTDGKIGGALALDGVNDYVSTDFILDPAVGPFSAFLWVKGGRPGQVILSQAEGGGGMNWLTTDSSSGWVITELKDPGRFGRSLWSQTTVTNGQWHRVGLTWDLSNRILYVDDVEVARDTQARLGDSTAGFLMGTGRSRTPGSFWSGLIDDVRIYSRAIRP